MNIKTLAEILAESDADSASSLTIKSKKPSKSSKHSESSKFSQHSYQGNPKKTTKTRKHSTYSREDHSLSDDAEFSVESVEAHSSTNKNPAKNKKRKKRFHPAANFSPEPSDVPAYQQPKAQSIKEMLAEVKQNIHSEPDDSAATDNEFNKESQYITDAAITNTSAHSTADNLPAALKAYLRTPEQRQADIDAIKAESRLRWLAFYYLSRREYGKAELKQKLLDKEQDPDKIDALLDEFEEKGYQSDYRTTLMLIRENIRKGRGRGRIKQEFYRKKIAMPGNIDELIDMANAESEEFSEFIDDSAENLVEGIDWLKLAVSARTKKYGDDIPTEQKDKARQLRFLQYRGFNTDICFEALNYTLETLDERF
ncbi:regulatory protein RecX [Psychrobacter immobilis]|uniref:regulatory protein RecX n=1 Tax=Psychrobacter immobilis TaxID=498 RepID=UPI001918615E|nr:regulatory protein RecX [Psychrobacter immobilis]